jgi:hypothetical protein
MILILILALLAIPFRDYYVMDTLGMTARPGEDYRPGGEGGRVYGPG